MTTHISKDMIAASAIDADKIDASAIAAILTKLGIGDIEARVAAIESAPAPSASSFDVGDYAWSARAAKTKWLLCNGAAVSRTTYADLFTVLGTRYGAGDGSTTFNLPNSAGRMLLAAGTGAVTEAVAAASWNATTDVITVASNTEKWPTGRKVRLTTTGSLPAGLALATDYYVIRLTATTIQLASSLANAVAGSPINFTTAGSGTHTITHTFTTRTLGNLGGEETHALTVAEIPAHTHNYNTYNTFGGSSELMNTGSVSFTSSSASEGTGGSGDHNNMPPYQVENLFIYAGV